jgi:microcystin-dependent protein
MAAALKLTITTAGRSALVNANKNGTNAVVISQVGVTQKAFTPDTGMTTMPAELKRLSTISGGATDASTMHVTIRDNSADQYSLLGLGLYLADGTLFAVYSQPTLIGQKSPQASLLIALDVKFTDIDAASLQFGDTNFQLNVATTDTVGVVRLALNSDAIAGTDAAKAMTPASTKAALDDRLGANAPTAFVKTLLALATAANFRNALAIKSAALSDAGTGNGLDSDLLDGQHGDFYLQFANLKNVPATWVPSAHTHAMTDIVGLLDALAAKLDVTARYYPGQIIVTAAKALPPCTLLCNGQAVSRTQYAALFAAIGTVYGAGDGNTTFNVPNLREGTAVRVTVNPNSVGLYDAGQILTHTHGASASAVGDHTHSVSLNNGGSHSHGASADAQGDHTHYTWTDGQGDHNHVTLNSVFGTGSGSSYVGGSGPAFRSQQQQTNKAGNHGHNIGMNGPGNHSHNIYIAAVGDHNHGVNQANAGGHGHTITVNATGGGSNLPAGTYLLHCIAY